MKKQNNKKTKINNEINNWKTSEIPKIKEIIQQNALNNINEIDCMVKMPNELLVTRDEVLKILKEELSNFDISIHYFDYDFGTCFKIKW